MRKWISDVYSFTQAEYICIFSSTAFWFQVPSEEKNHLSDIANSSIPQGQHSPHKSSHLTVNTCHTPTSLSYLWGYQ